MRDFLNAVSWQSINLAAKLALSAVSIVLITKYISKEQYPLLVAGSFIVAIYRTSLEAVISQPIISLGGVNPEIRRWIRSWILVASAVLAIFIMSIVSFQDIYEITYIHAVMLFSGLIFWSLSQTYRAIMRARLQFKALSLIDTSSTILSIAVMTLGVLETKNITSVFFAQALYFASNLLLFKMFASSPREENLVTTDLSSIFAKSPKLMVSNLLNSVANYADNLFIAIFLPNEVFIAASYLKDLIFRIQMALGFFISQSLFPFLKYWSRSDNMEPWRRVAVMIVTILVLVTGIALIFFHLASDFIPVSDSPGFFNIIAIYIMIANLKILSSLINAVFKTKNLLGQELSGVFVYFGATLIIVPVSLYLFKNISYLLIVPAALQLFLGIYLAKSRTNYLDF